MNTRRLRSFWLASSFQLPLCGAALALVACGSISSSPDAGAADGGRSPDGSAGAGGGSAGNGSGGSGAQGGKGGGGTGGAGTGGSTGGTGGSSATGGSGGGGSGGTGGSTGGSGGAAGSSGGSAGSGGTTGGAAGSAGKSGSGGTGGGGTGGAGTGSTGGTGGSATGGTGGSATGGTGGSTGGTGGTGGSTGGTAGTGTGGTSGTGGSTGGTGGTGTGGTGGTGGSTGGTGGTGTGGTGGSTGGTGGTGTGGSGGSTGGSAGTGGTGGSPPIPPTPPAPAKFSHYFVDVNHDGKADWIQVSRSTNEGWVGLATGSGNFQRWTNYDVNRGAGEGYEHYFADVNGDQRPDWIQVSRTVNDGWVGLANADGSFVHWSNHNVNRGAVNGYAHYFAKVNKDNRADWIQVSRTVNNGWVGLANTDGTFVHWTNENTMRGNVNGFEHYFADVNNDGCADWIQVSRTINDGWVGLSQCDGSFEYWTNHDVNRGNTNGYAHYFADVNGDGSADWIQVSRTDNNGWVGLADGMGNFQHWTNENTMRGNVNGFEHYFVDLNKDGCADWIQVSRTINDGWVGLSKCDGTFEYWTNHDVNRGNTNGFAHYFADVDGDACPDWIQVSRATNDGWVGLSHCDGTFQYWTKHETSVGAAY